MSLVRILLLIVVLVFVGLFTLWTKTPDLIARNLSDKLGVKVKIKDIDLSMNTIKVEGIEIANPQGSFLPKAFSADAITVTAPLTHFLKDGIVIEEIELDGLYVSLEAASITDPAGNWSTILGNMKKGETPAPTPAPKKEDQDKTGQEKMGQEKVGQEKTLLIKKLVLTNLNADLVYKLKDNSVKKLPTISRIELANISSTDGVGADQIAKLILEQCINSLLQKENLPSLFNQAMENPKGTLDTLKGLLIK